MWQTAASGDVRSALMASAQAGEARAYTTLLRDCVPIISRVARCCGVPADQVDDVVQDVLLTLHQARAAYDPRRPFDAWLRVIAERRAIDLLRRTLRRGAREVYAPLALESHVDATADPERSLHDIERVGQAEQALAKLPERQREAVRHLVIDERSLAEAAAATGRSTTALKVNLHRAIKALRERSDLRQ